MAAVDEVLADLGAEGDDLDDVVAGLDAAQWRLATPAPGWTIAHQIAHLADTDRLATLAATDAAAFEARKAAVAADFDAVVEARAAKYAADSPADLLARWRAARARQLAALAAVPAGEKVPWMARPVTPATLATTRMMELFGHGQDILDALGVQRRPTDRIIHVAWLGVKTRDFTFTARGLTPPAGEFRVELTAPDGQLWTWGPPGAAQVVSGPAMDFCLLVTQRRHRDDLGVTARGADADRWLSIAQAYVGPPGKGREPGQFAQSA
jgi:enediyne biosynthesis protein E11